MIGMPALNLPLMAVEGMPLGLQMLGFYQDDEALTALGHWAIHAVLRGED